MGTQFRITLKWSSHQDNQIRVEGANKAPLDTGAHSISSKTSMSNLHPKSKGATIWVQSAAVHFAANLAHSRIEMHNCRLDANGDPLTILVKFETFGVRLAEIDESVWEQSIMLGFLERLPPE